MIDIPVWSIQLSKAELWYLAGVLETGSLIGFEDPISGWEKEEIDQEIELTKASLARRGFIKIYNNDELVIDASVRILVDTITTSYNILMAVSTFGGETASWLYFIGPNLIVELNELINEHIVLSAIKEPQFLLDRLVLLLDLHKSENMESLHTFSIQENTFQLIREEVTKDLNTALLYMLSSDVTGDAASSVLSSLKKGRYIDSLIRMERSEGEIKPEKSLEFLMCEEGCWIVEKSTNAKQDTELHFDWISCDSLLNMIVELF